MKPSMPIKILFEDSDIIVCVKPTGIATQTKSHTQRDVVDYLKQHLYTSSQIHDEPYLAIIHRLDQPVSGILVFAKTPRAAKGLNQQLTSTGFGKHYKALIKRSDNKPESTLIHHLKKNGRTNTSSVCSPTDKAGKIAKLHYQLFEHCLESDYALFSSSLTAHCVGYQLAIITLDTGRHHQIRVQLAHIGRPILGDSKYGETLLGNTSRAIALCAYKLEFIHPISKEELCFELPYF